MKKVILIKYGELTTKKDNRNYFIKTLKRNIFSKLSSFSFDVRDDYYRMFIYANENDINDIVKSLSNIFGIHEIDICLMSETKEIDNIKNISLKLLENKKGTFKVETNRSDKSYEIKSMDISRNIGAFILKNTELKVDVHNPDIKLNIEIRHEGVYLYTNDDAVDGLRGYPVGTLGRGLLMLSGGIDSPVAGYLTMKRGVELYYLYFESRPHTSIEAKNKVISLAKKLEKYNYNGKLLVVNFTKIQENIYKNLDNSYLITIMRRIMYKIAEKIAIKNKCLAIVNGESIGQVASQTLSSMLAVNEVTNYPILRPLCSFDKLEIIKISKEIDTYDISILPYEDCCTIFVPKHPVINPSLKHIKSEEEKFDFSILIDEAINNIEIIDLHKNNDYIDLL